MVVAVRKDVEAGLSLSEALEKHPEVFSRLYVEMVKAGEIGGILDGVLLRIADQLERDQDLRRKIRSAMTYPIVVLALRSWPPLSCSSLSCPSSPGCSRISGGRSRCRPGFACSSPTS